MVQPLQNPKDDPPASGPRPPLTLLPAHDPRREALVRELALDRLRELHDDGVTADYVGRMYGVSGDYVQETEDDLRRDRGPLPPTPGALFT